MKKTATNKTRNNNKTLGHEIQRLGVNPIEVLEELIEKLENSERINRQLQEEADDLQRQCHSQEVKTLDYDEKAHEIDSLQIALKSSESEAANARAKVEALEKEVALSQNRQKAFRGNEHRLPGDGGQEFKGSNSCGLG